MFFFFFIDWADWPEKQNKLGSAEKQQTLIALQFIIYLMCKLRYFN